MSFNINNILLKVDLFITCHQYHHTNSTC